MIVSAVKCKKCKNTIYSRSRHDFRYCDCGATFVDGGFDYLRYGWEPSVGAPDIVTIEVEVFDESKAKQIMHEDWNSGRDLFGKVLGSSVDEDS